MKKPILLSLMIVCAAGLLAACAAASVTQPTASPDGAAADVTPAAAGSATADLQATRTAFAAEMMAFQVTRDDVPTATTTALPSMTFPDWVRDPDTSVVILQAVEGFDLLNVNTGERLTVGLPYVDEVRWVSAADGIYLIMNRHASSGADYSIGFNEVVDLATGALVRYDVRDSALPRNQLADPPPVDNGNGVTYQVVTQSEWVTTAGANPAYDLITRKGIVLTDTITGNGRIVFGDLDRLDGRAELVTITAGWFEGGNLLGATTRQDDGNRVINTVYAWDASGEIVAWYDGATRGRFSPTSPMVVYRKRIGEQDTVCLSNVTQFTGADFDCTPLTYRPLTTIRDFEWSPDGQRILFSYRADDGLSGGLCAVDANDLSVVECAIERTAQEEANFYFTTYDPENRYGVFTYQHMNLGDSFDDDGPGSGLCLVDPLDLGVNCISDDFKPADHLIRLSVPSRSGHMLAVTFGNGFGGPGHQDGLCLINLRTGTTICPTVAPYWSYANYIERVSWSPDDRYLLIMRTDSGEFSDDKTSTSFGVVDVGTGTYREEEYALHENNLDELWRPALKP